MEEMTASTNRIFPFSLRYNQKGYHQTVGKDVQLTTSNAFYSIATVINVISGIMMVSFTAVKRSVPVVKIDHIPLHQIKSCRLYL